MKTKSVVMALFISIIVAAATLGMTVSASYAQDSESPEPTVFTKLDEVIGNQKIILEALAALKEELEIVKIRVTQSQ